MISLLIMKYYILVSFVAIFLANLIHFKAFAQESLGFSLKQEPSLIGKVEVTVQDDSTEAALMGAQIRIEERVFDASTIVQTTGTSGQLSLDWDTRVKKYNLTIDKTGYSRLTLIGISANQVSVFLKPIAETPRLASGHSDVWLPSLGRSTIQAGIVFKSLSPTQFISFDLGGLLSPLKDQIDVWGKRDVPSNVVFPDQTISVIIGSSRINKPDYRLPLRPSKTLSLTHLQLKVKVSDLLSDVQNKKGISTINHLTFTQSEVSPDSLNSGNLSQDFKSPQPILPAKYTVTVNELPFKSDLVVGSFAFSSGREGIWIPNDFKVAASLADQKIKPVNLGAQNADGIIVAAFALGEHGSQVAGVLEKNPNTQAKITGFNALPLIADFNVLPNQIPLVAPANDHELKMMTFEEVVQSTEIAQPAQPSKSLQSKDPIALLRKVFAQPVPTINTYWSIVIFPGATNTDIPTQTLGQFKITSYGLTRLDFPGLRLNGDSFDGRSELLNLKSFARSTAKLK